MLLFITKHGQEPSIFTGRGHLTEIANDQLQVLPGACQDTHLLTTNCLKKSSAMTFNVIMVWRFLIRWWSLALKSSLCRGVCFLIEKSVHESVDRNFQNSWPAQCITDMCGPKRTHTGLRPGLSVLFPKRKHYKTDADQTFGGSLFWHGIKWIHD